MVRAKESRGSRGRLKRRTWWCRDEYDATVWGKIDKVVALQHECVVLRCEDEADGVGGPAEADARAALGVQVSARRLRRDTVDVRDVAAVGHAKL